MFDVSEKLSSGENGTKKSKNNIITRNEAVRSEREVDKGLSLSSLDQLESR